jgi:pyrroline-5-carboxylate reductase
MKVSFIGFGNMAKAIARGLAKEGLHSLSAAAPSLSQGINKDNIQTHSVNTEVIQDAEIIILAVKPMQMNAVLEEITPFLPPHCLLISVAAGLNLSWFAKRCGSHHAIVRTMPNTPASIGLAATPMIANNHTTVTQKQWAELIFSTIGITTWVSNEEEIDSFTALSGSGPAYVFLFVEAMINAGVALGLEESIAKTFALQTCQGALKLAEKSNLSLTELRTQVTSPGGTTAAALSVLDKHLQQLVLAAMNAAKSRSVELGQLY